MHAQRYSVYRKTIIWVGCSGNGVTHLDHGTHWKIWGLRGLFILNVLPESYNFRVPVFWFDQSIEDLLGKKAIE